jgi:hypothetical protein
MRKLLLWTIVIFCIFSLGVLYAEDEEEDPLEIQAIPYSMYDFNSHSDGITILGWSKDGKMLYEENSTMGMQYLIIDLIEDVILWDFDVWSGEKNESEIPSYVASIAKQYKIEPAVHDVGEFPCVSHDGYEFRAFSSNDRLADPESNQYEVEVDIFVNQWFSPYKMKKINMIQGNYSWALENISENLIYRYAKSPFEDRIAVIVGVPRIHISYDYLYYTPTIFGCLLSSGFNL